mgnify:FL=1
MTNEQMQTVVRRVIEEAFNQGKFDVIPEVFAPDFIENQFGLHATFAGMQKDIDWLRATFPDLHLTIEEMAVSGDRVWTRSTARGTHSRPFMGPPTGKTFEIAIFDELRFANGKIVEHWGTPDRFAQFMQLGLLPRPQAQPAGD